MKKYTILLFLAVLSTITTYATVARDTAFIESKVTLPAKTGNISGVLSLPASTGKAPVALIIAGSGPTDRDGNSAMTKNNSLKMLSDALLKQGIATLRYDKRGVGESVAAGGSEVNLRFDDYVDDAKGWVALLKADKRFSKVVVIGHSEGSLIGMIAAVNADQFVSIAGVGRPANQLLLEQIGAQSKQAGDAAAPILDSLKNGFTVKHVNIMLLSLFRPSIQPYMISWFKYDPQVEIAKLRIPVLLIQGTNDIQVSVEDAKRLAAASPKSTLVLIEKMNHLLKLVEGDRAANMKTYNEPDLPIVPELAVRIGSFIFR
jgi:uncharacterized protein